jgi:hypothetical protein
VKELKREDGSVVEGSELTEYVLSFSGFIYINWWRSY